MITHLVVFTWKPGTDAADIAAIKRELKEFIKRQPGVVSYRLGPNAGLTDDAADYGIAATFSSVEAWRAYAEHPDHLDIIERRIAPFVATRTATQFEHYAA